MYAQYTRLHDHTWDEVMQRMYAANMRNFVVYLHGELSARCSALTAAAFTSAHAPPPNTSFFLLAVWPVDQA